MMHVFSEILKSMTWPQIALQNGFLMIAITVAKDYSPRSLCVIKPDIFLTGVV